jgi:hypothetical protein
MDLMPIDLLMLIPHKYLAMLVLFFGCPAILSESLVWLKKLTGNPSPADSKLRTLWFVVLGLLDVLARNSPMAKCQVEAMWQRQEIETHKRKIESQNSTISKLLNRTGE